ncbi:hypothetical protein [Pelosinus sp. sgz500959]|uniref:hypothetical protein n=1 Tax=Pelosinus sp. sgz500959 TaxID=3242472 RepID=UPI00366FD468
MSTMVKKNKNIMITSVIKNSFKRDILILILVSIVIGSLLAGTVSLAANSYFSKTLANLVGDYGEYDFIIQSREEMKEDTAVHIQKIIDEVFPGARMKEGPTITGKTSFFIAVPEEYKTKNTYEDLGKIFGGIPGGAGVGVLTEPRLTLRGVPEGAKNMLIEKISQMPGVRFAFHDGASLGVVLTSLDQSTAVNGAIKELLKKYQVIEISFPVGSEPQNPIRMGEGIANAMQTQLQLEYAQNVSIDGKNDDMTYMVSTMMELKRFLQAYASQVVIAVNGNEKVSKGDFVAFSSSPTPLALGEPISKNNIIVEITGVRPDGSVEGKITQNDAAALMNPQGYKVTNNMIGSSIGTATIRNPRQELSGALAETSKVVSQIPGFASDVQNLSSIATTTLNNYGASIKVVNQTLDSLESAGNTIQSATAGLANIDTSALQGQLDSSSRAMGGLVNTLQVFKLLNGDVGATLDTLSSAQRNIGTLKSGLGALDHVAADARKAKGAIDNIVVNGHNAIGTLQAFDVNGTQNNLASVTNRLAQLGQLNIPLMTTQLQYMSASVPNLKDDEINHSVNLLDKFIAGQVIPGERIQILTTSNMSIDAITPVVYNQVGHHNVSLYSTDLGVIEPNPRGELYGVLNEVRAILAAMTASVLTLLFLALDHTAVMTVIRRRRVIKKGKILTALATPERCYGMAVGAVILTVTFILTRAGIPYLPWVCVPIIGAVLGLIVASYTEKISPVSGEEIMAGQSLGLSMDEIMREIVIPSGRPGLLQKLNQRHVKFK